MKRWMLTALAVLTGPGIGYAQSATNPVTQNMSLTDAPANTWVKVCETPTGGRDLPLFLYVPTIKKFVLALGMQSCGGVPPRHYDTEEFDLAAAKWVNAYPPAVAAGRPESGPVGQDYSKAREKMAWGGAELWYKEGDLLRPGCGGQWQVSRMNYEFAFVPDGGKVYAYVYNKTICYDPVARAWEETGAKPRTSCRIWGSMCYDPVNKEILHSGGDGGSAAIGTWVYSIASNEWRKLEFGSPKRSELTAKAKDLRWQAKTLLGACCNRFAVSETEAESKADLAAKAAELAATAAKFRGEVTAAGLAGTEKAASEAAAQRLDAAAAATKVSGPTLAGKATQENIAAIRAVRVIFEQVVDALAVEPPGRARSQSAYDPVHKKIVIFGGDGLDRVLSDTWVYDCATRTWEQRFPPKAPSPRAGHVLAWLPKSGRIVLAGGYSRVRLPHELWTYDVAANEWKLLLHVPIQKVQSGRETFTISPGCPRLGMQAGAVNEDDVLVCASLPADNYGRGLVTWACKVNPARVDEDGTASNGVASGSYTFNAIDPADWEKAAQPDVEKMRQTYRDMPVNQWTALKFPRYAPGARNRWGTTAYDADRHQLLFWGGGHSTSAEDDVSHFSVLGGCWTVGYHPDDPIEIIYASVPTPVSFHDRPHVPMHAYKAYDYDRTLGKMLYFDRAYDPAVREWEPVPLPGLEHCGELGSFQAATPRGMVCYSAKGLFRFDAKAGQWQKMPWNGPVLGGIYADGHDVIYDSKRDCLWMANDKVVLRYDMASGKAEKVDVRKPKALGQFFFWSEAIYVPGADLILIMNLFAKPHGQLGNAIWDPADGKFYWADLRFVENDKPAEFKGNPFSWSDALRYDPGLKLAVLNNSSACKVWALKFDRKTANLQEMEPEAKTP